VDRSRKNVLATVYRLPAALASADAARKTVLSDIAERYSQAVAAQMKKTALCNQVHTLEQRFRALVALELWTFSQLMRS
jgi:hypothetical protein